jgi:hypothetical protein
MSLRRGPCHEMGSNPGRCCESPKTGKELEDQSLFDVHFCHEMGSNPGSSCELL